MQISKIQSPTFNGIHAQTTKMTRAQRELTSRLTDAISYTDQYAKAKNMGIDICIFPKGLRNIKAKFLDTHSENFIKHKNKQNVTFFSTLSEKDGNIMYSTAGENKAFYKNVDNFINKLEEILSCKFGFEEVDYEKINAKDTDMFRLFNKLNPNEIDASSSVIAAHLE